MESEFITTTPPLSGRIKQRYSDFIVEEVLVDGTKCGVARYNKQMEEREQKEMKVPPHANEEHLLLDMEKINIDTSGAVATVSRGLNVSKKRIGYAGLKDKRAITCQRISIYLPNTELVEKFGVRGVELRNPQWSNTRIELGDLKGNQFTITIRNIDKPAEEARKILKDFGKQAEAGVPNFFGNQRFGGKRMVTHKIGKLLLQGKFEDAVMLYLTETFEDEKEDLKNARINFAKNRDAKLGLKEFPFDARAERAMLNHLLKNPNDYAGAFLMLPKKIRYLFTHAYQSHLFNKMLSQRIKKFGAQALKPIDGDLLEEGEPVMLLPGYESGFAQGRAGEIERNVMKEEGVDFRDFRTSKMSELSSQGARKPIILVPKDFQVLEIIQDEFNEGKNAATISFFLSKGNYATTVLRELMKEEIF